VSYRTFAFLIAAMIFAAPIKLGAQENWPVEPRDRVRVTLKRDHSAVVGIIQTIESNALVIQPKTSGLRTVALRDIARLEISRGERTGALKGAAAGFVIFGLAGALAWGAVCEADFGVSPGTSSREPCPGEAALVGVGTGAVGALLGAVIGSFIRTDRWDEAPLNNLRIGSASILKGGFVLSASVSTDFLRARIGL
jgi:hypothetical protein